MKKLLVGAIALIGVAAAPGVAAAQTTATAGIHFGNIEPDVGIDVDNYGLDAAFSHDFGGWTFQADGVSERLDGGGSEIGVGYGTLSAGVRNDSYALYGFLGHETLAAASGIQFGVGGQFYMSQLVVNGSVGQVDFDGAEITGASADATWYFMPNFGVGVEAGWGEADITGDPDWSIVGLNAQWRFDGSPFAVDLAYRQVDGDAGGDADQWRLGFTLQFGTSTAQEHATDGPSFNGGRRLYETSFWAL